MISLRGIGIRLSILTAAVCLPYFSTPGAAQTAPLQITTVVLPGGHAQSAYNTSLAASGGTTPYAWSIAAGTLPAGLSLDANSGAITGTPAASGQSTFTVVVADSGSQSATADLSIGVAPAPLQIITVSLPGGQVQSAYSTILVAFGGSAPYTWSVTAGTLPAGLSLNANTGGITGIPVASGLSTFAVTVADSGSQSATTPLSIGIAPAPLQIITAGLPGGQVQSAYGTTLAASGGTTPYTWSITAGTLPAGLSLNASTGAITGIPVASGPSTFAVNVADSASQSATTPLSINIAPAPLQINTASLPGGQVQSAYSTTLAASGGTTPYAWSIPAGTLPAGLSLNASTGTITGTPAASGQSTFTVKVADSASQSAATPLSINIAPAPLQVTTATLPDGLAQRPYGTTLAASGGTTPYTWSITAGTLPPSLSLNASTGAITGTPAASGRGTFTVTVADSGSQSATTPLSINIAPAPPPASPAIPSLFFGMALQETSTNWPTVSINAFRTSAVSWRKIELQKGIFDWGEMDRQVALALQHGAPVYYTTDGIPSWFSASNLADWDTFVTALATRYKGKIEIYELWNEPEYDALPPLATFVVMTQHMRDIIRSIDPAAKIASPGVDTVSYIDSFWAAGGPKDVDVVALHGYPYGSQPETIVQKATEMKGYMSKYGINKPLYDSEGSYGSDYYGVISTADRTNFIPRYELLHWSSGITRHYWYSWDDSASSTDGIGWGTLYDAVKNQILPMAATYQQTYNWMAGATLPTPCSMAADSTWTCVLTRPGGYQALAIWNPSGSKQYTPAGIYTQYKDVSGNVIPISGPVTIGNSPVLLEATGGTAPPPTLQIITSSLPGGQTGSAYTGSLASSGGTAPYSWSVTTGLLPAGLSLNAATGAITGTPATAALSTFTVTVGDSGASPQSASAQLSITVSAPTPPPSPLVIATSTLPGGQSGSAYTASLTSSGGTAPFAWSITAGSLPAGLSLNTATGAITGTPATAALSTFTVTVGDSGTSPQSASAQLSITISATTPPPPPLVITTSTLAAAQVGTAYSTTLAASGGAAPYAWSLSAGALPPGLTLNAGTGAISGTPTASGQSTFTVKVADSAASPQSSTAQLSINVAPAPPPLVITTSTLAAAQVGTAYSTALAASGGTAPYAWSLSTGALPAGLTLNAGTGVISGTPTASGQSTFTVKVADSAASPQSSTAQLSINVMPATLRIQTASLPNGQVNVAYSTTMTTQGGTPPYTWTVFGTLPAGLSLNSSTGSISGTPTAAATSSFTMQVTDSASQTASGPFSITVSPATTATAFNRVVVVVEENTNYTGVIGSSQMPYLNSLASQYGLATQYYADTHPSIGNYLMMITGQVITNDDAQIPSTLPVSADNVVRHLIAAGKTWKSYAEDLPSVGYTGGDSGNYAVRHNPLAYLTDVQNSATQKQNLVPFTQFNTDRTNGALPNYSFVVPNLCNDAHDCGLNVADSWLQTNIAPLVNDANFQKDGLLIILFDESGSDNTHGGGRVPLIVVTPQARKQFQSTTLYQHESLLRLTLQALGVQSWPGAAAAAPAMSEFFTVPLP